METAETYINALGGTVAVANSLGLAPTTVSSWKSSGSIPRWRRDDLEKLARTLGVATPAEFKPKLSHPRRQHNDTPSPTSGRAA